jgi:hypothetical protein
MKSLPILAVLALIALLAVQEARFRHALNALRSQAAANATSSEDSAAAARNSEELRDATRQLNQARADLATAQQRLAAATDQIQQLRPHIAVATRLPRRNPALEPGLPAADPADFNPAIDPVPPRRAWGEEQATGAPDTFQAGDISTAWAPRLQDGGEEWLHLDYSNPVQLAEVRVRETHNPGAISKIAAVLPNGQEIIVWEGVEEAATPPVDRAFPVSGVINASSVRVYLDTRRVSGWNEIDAVELVGRDGSRQWAAHARASSSYADPR